MYDMLYIDSINSYQNTGNIVQCLTCHYNKQNTSFFEMLNTRIVKLIFRSINVKFFFPIFGTENNLRQSKRLNSKTLRYLENLNSHKPIISVNLFAAEN
jgi:hypothetical protein